MIDRARRLVWLSGLVPTLAAALLCLSRPPFIAPLENATYDALLRAVPARAHGGRVVIVDVDDRSLSAIGQWPWRRDVLGQLITRLAELGASTIALDVIFAESDRNQKPEGGPDAALAETLQKGRVVLGYAFTFEGTPAGSSACVQHALGLAIVRRGEESTGDPWFRAAGAVCNLPVLTRAARASGFLNAAPDADGILRRVPLLIELDGRVYPGLALAALVSASGTRDLALRVDNVNSSSLLLDKAAVPLDGKSNLLLRYRGAKRTFPYVSAADVLTGRASPASFKDKIVFIGTTALGTREVVATPLDTLFAGVEVQATVADNLLQRDFIHRPEHGIVLETHIVLVLGVAIALIVGRFGLAWGSVAVAACLAAVWGISIGLLSASGTLLSPLFATGALTIGLGTMTLARFTIERRRADRAGDEKAKSQRLMVQALLSLTEVRDAETGRHSRRTQQYTRILAERLARNPRFTSFLTPERVDLLASLAPLHDIGKVGVPDRLLNKPGVLTAEEQIEMRKHPAHGRDVILHAQQEVGAMDDVILGMAKEIVYTHHERWDGSGYPQGLRGTDIPIPGRIMAVVDAYDAILTRRLYRVPLSHEQAVACIVAERGSHFDPDVVDAFIDVAPLLARLTADGGSPAAV